MAEFNHLIIKRGQAKAKLTRITNFLSSLTDNRRVSLLKSKLKQAQSAFRDFNEWQGEIEILDADEIESNEREIIEDQYSEIEATIEDLIANKAADTTHLVSTQNSSNETTIGTQVKLPVLNVPSFAGISGNTSTASGVVTTIIKSKTSNYTATVDCLILQKITDNLPHNSFKLHCSSIPNDILLADPQFNESGTIDLLIGAELYWNVLGTERIKAQDGRPHYQNTRLGWIAGGPVQLVNSNVSCSSSQSDILEKLVSKLYRELELPINKTHLSEEELACDITKHNILSVTAELFNPLGLISPVITKAKLILQQLWLLKLSWDRPVPPNMSVAWTQFLVELTEINQISIPRKALTLYPTKTIEVHAFSDASMQAYGAVIYLRCTNRFGEISTKLLCAKSRVAPIKSISLPRLELCGALLLARLVTKIQKVLNFNINKRYFWTDSTIVLAWLTLTPNNWNTFVANRVSEIQEQTLIKEWHHINSTFNAADVITREASPRQLINHTLWWSVDWLNQSESKWPKSNVTLNCAHVPEKRKPIILISTTPSNSLSVLTSFSSYTKLQRVMAYVLRFLNNAKNKDRRETDPYLSCDELNKASTLIIKLVQQTEYAKELNLLRKHQYVAKDSKLYSLNPFLDEQDVIRVGGRLKHSTIPYDRKFPMVLPAKHHVTKLLVIREHERHLHAGPLATLCALREKVWIVAGRSVVRNILHKCVKCFRSKPRTYDQLMSELPTARVTATRPFLVCGVDYAGPIYTREVRGRDKRHIKSYIALFICFATRAVHLELVGDYSTDSFLGALKRFVSRRGIIRHIHSDNATNFVGAKREIDSLKQIFSSKEFESKIINHLVHMNIKWSFIPPYSPHRGGLWEAGVKSAKYHLKRVIGNAILTFEELSTVLVQIEACLNSRPLCPMSSDPNNLHPLTPGHFLIGDPLTFLPEPDITHIKMNRLSRWQLVQQMHQHF